jgi:hypothetical protein
MSTFMSSCTSHAAYICSSIPWKILHNWAWVLAYEEALASLWEMRAVKFAAWSLLLLKIVFRLFASQMVWLIFQALIVTLSANIVTAKIRWILEKFVLFDLSLHVFLSVVISAVEFYMKLFVMKCVQRLYDSIICDRLLHSYKF